MPEKIFVKGLYIHHRNFFEVVPLGKLFWTLWVSANLIFPFPNSSWFRLVYQLLFFAITRSLVTLQLPSRITYVWNFSGVPETQTLYQSSKSIRALLNVFVCTVREFLPQRFSNGIIFHDVCAANLITHSARLNLFSRFRPFSRIIKGSPFGLDIDFRTFNCAMHIWLSKF